MTPQERKNFESIRDNVHGEPMTQTMKLALEALEMVKANADDWQQRTGKEIKGWMQPVNNSITDLRQAIEQAQKPEHIQKLEELGWSSEAINKANTPQQKQEPVATVAEVHMSRYTIEWTNGPLPEGTQLYISPPQQKQEPVAWLSKGGKGIWFHEPDASLNATPLYTSPPQRQPLTDEEMEHIWKLAQAKDWGWEQMFRAIEAAHGIKENQ